MSLAKSPSHTDTPRPDLHAWTPFSWRSRPIAPTAMPYSADAPIDEQLRRLAALPPLVTSWEVERLKSLLAEAQLGKRFLLHGGDCAENFADCRPDAITAKLKILLQMSMVLVYAGKKPVIRVARMAGQYAKPRSAPHEQRIVNGQSVELPSYYGDLVNCAGFTKAEREPDPALLVEGYKYAGLTLNFVRSLLDAGFADIHHPEYWELGFLQHAGLRPEVRDAYQRLISQVSDGLRFMQAMDPRVPTEPATGTQSVELFTSHEGLNLYYEAAQTRTVPRRSGYYNLSTHLPWIGERTRAIDGAHVEYFRGIANPIGVKVGPKATGDDLLRLIDAINPGNEPGKMVLIARMGRARVSQALGPLIDTVAAAGWRVLWVCDPMHGNTITTARGIKTRVFDDVLAELLESFDIHTAHNSHLGGVHIEMTGEDVTECLGGATGLSEDDLDKRYQSLCDPRLNYDQALEVAFALAGKLQAAGA